ncbi:ABC transporter permease [Candidatus Parcubacteria bacterium]|nr:ABC transporter permease [Candidatus Parcubacteria bacterium]
MKFIHLFKLSTRTFRSRTRRTFLTVFGVAIGIGAVLFLVSLGYGLQKMMLEQITTSEALLTLDVTSPKAEIISLSPDITKEISEIENVEEVSPLIVLGGQVTLGDLTSDTSIFSCYPSYFRLGGIFPSKGEFFEKETEQKIILSTALLKTFDLEPNQAIGKKVKFSLFLPKKTEEVEEIEIIQREEDYLISGIIEDNITPFAYLPLGTLEDLNLENFSQVKVKVSNSQFIEEVRDKIISMGFLVSSLSETVDEANKIFGAIKIILAVFGLVALFVAAIGLANTMTVALLERTNEIGVMKAIGGADKDIGRMFLIESSLIGFFGGIGGILLGQGGAMVFNGGLNILAQSLGGQTVDIFYSPLWFLLFIIIFATLVGFLSGFFPARKASKMNPLEALRYK